MTEQQKLLPDEEPAAEAAVEVVGETSIEDMIAEAAARGLFQPGKVYSNEQISNELYHRGPGESSSNLKHAIRSAAHWRAHKLHPKPSTAAMRFGTWLHTLVLEPDEFARLYVPSSDERLQALTVPDEAPRKPTVTQRNAKNPAPWVPDAIAWWDNFEALQAERLAEILDFSQGREVISTKPGADPYWHPSDWDALHRMRDALHEHRNARLLLQSFVPEQSLYWHEAVEVDLPSGDRIVVQELVKARFDARDLVHNIGWDLKTAVDASLAGFSRAVFDYGYHISETHYMRGQDACGMGIDAFVFVVVEKAPPYAVGLYQIDGDARWLGDHQRKRALATIAAAKETGEYPAYPVDPPIRELPMPAYAKRVDVM